MAFAIFLITFPAVMFGIMVMLHQICRSLVKKYKAVMPDNFQRDRYRHMELAMAGMCVWMIWHMFKTFEVMLNYCLTDRSEALEIYGPGLILTLWPFLAKVGHYLRLRRQAGLWSFWAGERPLIQASSV